MGEGVGTASASSSSSSSSQRRSQSGSINSNGEGQRKEEQFMPSSEDDDFHAHHRHIHDAGDCDRKKSKLVGRILEENLWPEYQLSQYEFPQGCALDTNQDVYKIQEQFKKRIRSSLWQCEACKKRFRREKWLDLHMDRKHSDLLVNSSTSTCLGELCGIFDCDKIRDEGHTWSQEGCDFASTSEERIHCISVAHKCFPPGRSTSAHKLHDKFVEEVCERVQCTPDGRHRSEIFEKKKAAPGLAALYYVSATLVMCLLFVFYFVYFTSYSPSSMNTDLRQARNRHGRFLDSIFKCCQRKKKIF